MYKGLAIFDLDGTLIDTIEDLGTAVNFVLESTGRPTHPVEDYRFMVGNGIRKLVQRALPEHEKEDKTLPDRLLPGFKRYYLEHIYEHSRPYPGVAELLRKLALEEGMVTLKEAGMIKVRAGLTSLQAAFEVTGGE